MYKRIVSEFEIDYSASNRPCNTWPQLEQQTIKLRKRARYIPTVRVPSYSTVNSGFCVAVSLASFYFPRLLLETWQNDSHRNWKEELNYVDTMRFVSHFVIMLWLSKDFGLCLVHRWYNQITTTQSTSSLPNISHFRHHCFLDIDNWNFTCSFRGVCCRLSFTFRFRSCWFRTGFRHLYQPSQHFKK